MASLEDIAKIAGVSTSTVSNVLNGRTKEVWPSVRERAERIRRIARRLGYRPNASARAIRTGRFGNIALLRSTTHHRSVLPTSLLDGLLAGLESLGQQLLVSMLPDDKLTDAGFVPRILREMGCDGMLVNYTDHIPRRMLELIEEHQIPSVWLNCKLPSDCVYPDDVGMARLAAQHLLSLGHQRIAYVDFTCPTDELGTAHYSHRDRRDGYAEVLTAAGLTPVELRQRTRGAQAEQPSLARQLLEGTDRPTAVLAYSPQHAEIILFVAAQMGLEVPKDLSIVAFARHEWSFAGRRLSTLVVPNYELGLRAAEAVARKLAAPNVPLPPKPVAATDVHFDSTCAPARCRLNSAPAGFGGGGAATPRAMRTPPSKETSHGQ